ncbi:MAG TPA: 3-oxoacid CoA-transferase subunit B [Dehalococcoidales bacterium]
MKSGLTRELICMRVAREFHEGDYINLGIGLPTQVSNFIPENMEVVLHCENGMLGYGRIASTEEIDPELVNAGSEPVTLKPGASFFDSATGFAMIRGGHINVTVLGAFEVSEKGDLANWMRLEKGIGSVGGSMDLICGSKKVIVAMEHTTRDGHPRIVKKCAQPLTGLACVDLIVTDMAVIEVTPDGLVPKEVAPGLTAEEVQKLTEPKLIISPELKEMEL